MIGSVFYPGHLPHLTVHRMGKIYNRRNLWPAEQLDLERQQFNNLIEIDQKEYDRVRSEFMNGLEAYRMLHANTSHDVNRSTSSVSFKKLKNDRRKIESFVNMDKSLIDIEDIHGLLNMDRKNAYTTEGIVGPYMQGICNYVNEIRRPKQVSTSPEPSEDEYPLPKYGYKSRPSEIPTSDGYMSCQFIENTEFNRLKPGRSVDEYLSDFDRWQIARELMVGAKADGKDFENLDYLFILYHDTSFDQRIASTGHYLLLGIAPKQKYVFAIDSLSYLYYNIDSWPFCGGM